MSNLNIHIIIILIYYYKIFYIIIQINIYNNDMYKLRAIALFDYDSGTRYAP